MLRSPRYVFVSHCLLAQGVRAEGLAKYFPATVRPVVQFCLDNDINIAQMPCPELLCPAGGLVRAPHGKKWYEQAGLRETSRRIAESQVEYMRRLIKAGFELLAVIGMEFSPACAVNYLNRGARIIKEKGIYVEELQAALARESIDVRFVGVNQRALKKLERDLHRLLEKDAAPAER